MANRITIRVSKYARALLCLMLAASLSAPFAPQTSSTNDPQRSTHLFDVASTTATIQANRGGTRLVEGARQRAVADAAFLAVRIDHSPLGQGRPGAASNEFSLRQFAACNRQSGRSPPQIS